MNKMFLGKCIDKAQHLSMDDYFCCVLNEYLFKHDLLFYDYDRNLIWVYHPLEKKYQVAVWLMDIVNLFENQS